MLSACAPVYLHDARLEQSATKANAALTGVNALQPFDDQLTNLDEFAGREDLAVADYWASVRDKNVLGLVALPDARRDPQMKYFAEKRLTELLGSGNVKAQNVALVRSLPGVRSQALEREGAYDRRADAFRRRYLEKWQAKQQPGKDGKQPKPPELSCKAALAWRPEELTALGTVDVLAPAMLESIKDNCAGAKGAADAAANVATELAKLSGGELAIVASEAADVEDQTKDKLSDRAAALQAVIQKAGQYQSAAGGLEAFRKAIETVLNGADAVTKAAPSAATKLSGWDQVDKAITEALRFTICNAPEKAVKAETKTEAKCGDIVPTSGVGRASAAWGILKALAQLQDANAPERRSANWLVAAKAIIAAEKAQAKLELEAAQANASASRRRMDALILESAGMAATVRWLEPATPASSASFDCVAGATGAMRLPNRNCAYAAYVTAWNRGRLPAEVLRYRSIQIDRDYAVKQSRAIAAKQYALATAGTGTLEDYAKGGIKPATLAQIALDVATIGVFAAK